MSEPDHFRLLEAQLEKYRKIAVAFSGGVDSTFLLAVAKRVLQNNVLALTVKTPYIPDWELKEAKEFCKQEGIRHKIIRTDIIPAILSNPVNRCYLCKHHVFTILKNEALKLGYENLADGTNADDTGVYRPGLKALSDLNILSPLKETGMTKNEIRRYSASMGLSTADKPAYACLLTRLPYNYQVKPEELLRIEKAEVFMESLGFAGSRVRNHGDLARIEIERERLAELVQNVNSSEVIAYFHKLGYRHITIDLEGYRSGSFDN